MLYLDILNCKVYKCVNAKAVSRLFQKLILSKKDMIGICLVLKIWLQSCFIKICQIMTNWSNLRHCKLHTLFNDQQFAYAYNILSVTILLIKQNQDQGLIQLHICIITFCGLKFEKKCNSWNQSVLSSVRPSICTVCLKS